MKKTVLFLTLSLLLLGEKIINYGINAHVPNERLITLIKQAGIQLIRIDINWYEVEPEKGKYNWERIDEVVRLAVERNIEILAVLAYTPRWANGGKGINYPPDDVEDWKRFVSRAVRRYKNKIKYWNLWNEPNVEKFWALDAEAYVRRILNPGAEAIKLVWPEAVLVGPEVTYLRSIPRTWNMWMRQILRKGGAKWFDIISMHIYKSEGPEEIFKIIFEGYPEELTPSIVELLEEEGVDNKPFWITETGWSTTSVTEKTQARFYRGFLRRMKNNLFPHAVVFYEIIDDPSPGVGKYGILRADYSKKPAYDAYANFIKNNPVIVEPPGEEEEEPGNKDNCAVQATVPYSLQSHFYSIKRYLLARNPEALGLYYRFSSIIMPALKDPQIRKRVREGLIQALEIFLTRRKIEEKDWALVEGLKEILYQKGYFTQGLFLEKLSLLKDKVVGRDAMSLMKDVSLIKKIKNCLNSPELP